MLPQLPCCREVNALVDLLKGYDIDAVLLMPANSGREHKRELACRSTNVLASNVGRRPSQALPDVRKAAPLARDRLCSTLEAFSAISCASLNLALTYI
jgi:hypothetical protein